MLKIKYFIIKTNLVYEILLHNLLKRAFYRTTFFSILLLKQIHRLIIMSHEIKSINESIKQSLTLRDQKSIID